MCVYIIIIVIIIICIIPYNSYHIFSQTHSQGPPACSLTENSPSPKVGRTARLLLVDSRAKHVDVGFRCSTIVQ